MLRGVRQRNGQDGVVNMVVFARLAVNLAGVRQGWAGRPGCDLSHVSPAKASRSSRSLPLQEIEPANWQDSSAGLWPSAHPSALHPPQALALQPSRQPPFKHPAEEAVPKKLALYRPSFRLNR
jgi:hypothetical protein